MLTVVDRDLLDLRHRRGGKPDRPPVVKRTHCVSVRVDDAELKRLDEWRGKVQRGEWMRLAALFRAPPQIPAVNAEALRLLSNLANNINQIAHKVNMGEQPSGLDEALAEVKELRRLLIEVRQ